MCSGAGNPAKPKRWGNAGEKEATGGVGTAGMGEEPQGGSCRRDGACGVRWTVGGRSCRGEGAAAGTSVCPEQVHTPMATSVPPSPRPQPIHELDQWVLI